MFDSGIHFDNPSALLFALLILPVTWIGWSRLTGMSRVRRAIVCAVRALLILVISATTAQPKWMERSDALTVILLIDRSRSISPQQEAEAVRRLAEATLLGREDVDRLGVVNIGEAARVSIMPDMLSLFEDAGVVVVERDATNLEEGVQLGLAIAPRDTATRFVLVSDGNETEGNLLAAAEIARANDIPIDVLRLTYDYTDDVMFDRITAPSQARQGQNVDVKLVLRANRETTGTLVVQINGVPIDLDPETEGMGRSVTLRSGVNALPVTLNMPTQGVQRIEAFFQADDPTLDIRTANNRADSVVIVGGEGRVLLIYEDEDEVTSLWDALSESQILVESVLPQDAPADLLGFTAYDSVILANVPAHAFSPMTHEALRQYVHDVGGGLMMLGGMNSFGAGGWINTAVSRALPVKLEPKETHRMPRGALVCIMHSSEIPSGNYIGQQSCIAAIDALSRLDYAGIIDFTGGAGGNAGCVWEYQLQEVGDKTAAISAAKKMQMGDMPDFTPSMQMALAALKTADAGQKHVIIISDGDPSKPPTSLVNQFAAANITISTVLAGGHASPQTMKWIAQSTGGEYYAPKQSEIPRIFTKEAMVIRRSMVEESEEGLPVYHQFTSRPGPFRAKMPSLPVVNGYVLTTPRPGYDPEVISSKESDPILAYWQYGLGKAVAHTSDAATRWSDSWLTWQGYRQYWEQLVRWSMRPSAPSDLLLETRNEGDQGIVEVRALTAEGGFARLGKVQAVVVSPSGKTQPITVYQTGPGRGQGEFTANEPGTWVVNLMRQAEDGLRHAAQAGLSVPYSPEFRTLTDNSALLTQLAEMTGGRDLPIDPRSANLFNRESLPRPESFTDLWTLAAILACSLLILDVATRRLAIDYAAMRRRVRELMNPRASSAGEGMDRLKQARGQVSDQLSARASTGRHGTPEDSEAGVVGTRFEADESDSGRPSVVEMAGEPGADRDAGRIRKSGGDRAEPADSGADQGTAQGPHTSRLLDAKRRAREQQRKQRFDGSDEGGSE
ncbi:MAG: VWA domain-containing protein [Planctomycetes bacterium]|nr:VWA domain-containing protein [Planctomycetota bacterium]